MAKSNIQIRDQVKGRSDGLGVDMQIWIMYDPLDDDNYIELIHQTITVPTADLKAALDSNADKIDKEISKAIKKAKKDNELPVVEPPPDQPSEWEQNDLDKYYEDKTFYEATRDAMIVEAAAQADRMNAWVNENKGGPNNGYPADFIV